MGVGWGQHLGEPRKASWPLDAQRWAALDPLVLLQGHSLGLWISKGTGGGRGLFLSSPRAGRPPQGSGPSDWQIEPEPPLTAGAEDGLHPDPEPPRRTGRRPTRLRSKTLRGSSSQDKPAALPPQVPCSHGCLVTTGLRAWPPPCTHGVLAWLQTQRRYLPFQWPAAEAH